MSSPYNRKITKRRNLYSQESSVNKNQNKGIKSEYNRLSDGNVIDNV